MGLVMFIVVDAANQLYPSTGNFFRLPEQPIQQPWEYNLSNNLGSCQGPQQYPVLLCAPTPLQSCIPDLFRQQVGPFQQDLDPLAYLRSTTRLADQFPRNYEQKIIPPHIFKGIRSKG